MLKKCVRDFRGVVLFIIIYIFFGFITFFENEIN